MAGIMCLSSPSLQTVRFVNKPTNCVRWNSAARTVAVLAEEAVSPTNGSRLTTGTLCAVTVARKIADACGGCPVEIFSVSSDGRGAELTAQEASRIHGVDSVLYCEHSKIPTDSLTHRVPELITPLLHKACLERKYSHIVAHGSILGKDVLPRLASLMDMGATSDVIEVLGADTFMRGIYAGAAVATIKTEDPSTAFTPAPMYSESDNKVSKKALLVHFDAALEMARHLIDSAPNASRVHVDKPASLVSAKRVITGGRGLRTKDNFQMLYKLADLVGGSVGGTRAAVEAGFVPHTLQVGQTGKVIAPEVYFALGVSGALQHTMGMKDAKVIVAINKDPQAPIFAVADYGLVGDVLQIVPQLISAVEQEQKKEQAESGDAKNKINSSQGRV